MRIEIQQMNVDLENGIYKKVAFTGHRPPKIGGYDRDNSTRVMIRARLRKACDYLIDNCDSDEFMEGMALGIDQDAGDVILDIIEDMGAAGFDDPYIALHAAIPCVGQENIWPQSSQKYYRSQLERIEEYEENGSSVIYLKDSKPKNLGQAAKWMDERNEYMVDWCDLLIAVWDGTPGGTANCIQSAKRAGKPILWLKLVP